MRALAAVWMLVVMLGPAAPEPDAPPAARLVPAQMIAPGPWAEEMPPAAAEVPDGDAGGQGPRFGARGTAAAEVTVPACHTNLRAALPGSRACAPLRLVGERAAQTLLLTLAAPQPQLLRLAHRSGIDVLPQDSRIEVRVNGQEVGTIMPRHFAGLAADTLVLPAEVLQAGLNRIELRARHVHRIFCSPQTTYALWTEIDLASSAALPEADAPAPTETLPAFVAAVAAQAARGAPLVVGQPEEASATQTAAALMPLLQELAAATAAPPPALQIVSHWEVPATPAGTVRMPAARIALLPPEAAATPRVVEAGDGAQVLVLPHAPEAGGTAWAELLRADRPTAPEAPSGRLDPGGAVTLAALGYEDLSAAGQLQQQHVDITLPRDWLVLTSQRARLMLDHAIAPDLPEGAQLTISVNGSFVRLLPLDRRSGPVEPRLPVAFEARLLRPGANRITFDMVAPSPTPDLPCVPRPGPNVTVLASSEIEVPATPRMWQPDLRRALARLAPGDISFGAQAGAALSPEDKLRLRLLLAGSEADAVAGQAAPSPRLEVVLLQEAGAPLLTPGVRNVLAGVLVAPRGPGARAQAAPPPAAAEAGDGSLRDRAEALVTDLHRRLRAMRQSDDAALIAWLDGRQGSALLMQAEAQDAGRLLLVLSSASALEGLVPALHGAAQRQDGPRGQLALLDPEGSWQPWHARRLPLEMAGDLAPASLRIVLGNHASAAPGSFVGLFLGLIALSSLVMLALVIRTRRPDR